MLIVQLELVVIRRVLVVFFKVKSVAFRPSESVPSLLRVDHRTHMDRGGDERYEHRLHHPEL